MSIAEFELIQRYFASASGTADDVVLGIGDDAALLQVPEGKQLVVTVDTLIEGVHFPPQTAAADIGWKALAVNLSDLAAMGAQPAWFTLALTLPVAAPDWLAAFSQGMFTLARQYGVMLVGGDTTRGPLSVTIQAMGWVEAGSALQRGGAQVEDGIYLTGTLGDAALGLAIVQGRLSLPAALQHALLLRLNRPEPRIAEGRLLRGMAHCAIDVSDGLLADLQHMLATAKLGARLQLDQLPLSDAARQAVAGDPALLKLLLCGGDDYELCCCVSPQDVDRLMQQAAADDLRFTRIGTVESETGLRCFDGNMQRLLQQEQGYQHFEREEA